MGNEDYNRQVQWLMDEIKHSCAKGRKKEMLVASIVILIVLATEALMYFRYHDSNSLISDAVILCPFLVLCALSYIKHERIQRAVSPEELVTIYDRNRIWIWVCIAAIIVLHWIISDDGIGLKIYWTFTWGLILYLSVRYNLPEYRFTDDDGYFERLKELINNGK